MTGRGPWRRAEYTDECYLFYLRNPRYLRENLPISHGAERILLRIFSLNPQRRITLAELKEEVANLDTFFMSDAELSHAGTNARMIAASLEGHCPETPTNEKVICGDIEHATQKLNNTPPLDDHSYPDGSADITEMKTPTSPLEHARQRFADLIHWLPSIGASRKAADPSTPLRHEPTRFKPPQDRLPDLPTNITLHSQESADEVYDRFQNAQRDALSPFRAALADPEAFTIGAEQDSDSDDPTTPGTTATSIASVEVAGATDHSPRFQLGLPALALKRLRRVPSAADLRRAHGIGRLRAVQF